MSITNCPAKDQCTAVETVVSPVTQTAETAVNKASCNGVGSPLAEEKGAASNEVNRVMATRKAPKAKRAGERTVKSAMRTRNASHCLRRWPRDSAALAG
ncbi:hypothetical protein GCM10010525_04990 [Glutamicibacter bergerei]|uniref:Uncharacterized protein n=1 Tax=Glutamicibacter ardleyensis TaxID=225894 RepID=A0ABQ2DNE1_9MICC|nr:hypothetical protein GCM10007173_18230 [Glutamicibacter ardleyensis]